MTYQFHSQPFDHQRAEFVKNSRTPAWALLWEQGCGKSKPTIDSACDLWEAGEIDACVVVAPPGVHLNWETDELPAHMPPRVRPAVKTLVYSASSAKRKWFLAEREALIKHKGFAWLFISYNSFMTEDGKRFIWRFLQRRRCFYVLDEAHNIKSPGAKRTKSIVASGKYAPYRRILTGTPVTQGPFDVYSQIKFLDEGFWKARGIDGYTAYKSHFGIWRTAAEVKAEKGYDPGYDQLVDYRNLGDLETWLKEISSRVTKDEVLDLPPKLYSRRYYELTSQQRKLYDQLKSEMLLEFEDGSMTDGTLAIVRLLRLQQITCGYVGTDSDEDPFQEIDGKNPRLDLLAEITEGLSHPAIIWSRFSRDIDKIMDLLGSRAVRYDGKVSDEVCARSKAAFQAGDAQFFVGNTAKGATGLTLTQAKTMVYYTNNFKLVDRLQSEDRAHRIGQDSPVHYIDLIAQNTVDKDVVKALIEKYDIANKITGDQFKEWIR